MLRESRARGLAFATGAVVVGLAALFAWLRNPPGAGAPAGTVPAAAGPALAPPPADAARLAAGRAAFRRLDCTRCHAMEGVGNPRSPLDGVGARLDAAALREWSTGTGAARAELPAGALRAKARAAADAELELLIDYLAQSR